LIELLDYDYKAINIFFFIFMIFQIEFSFMGTPVNEFEKKLSFKNYNLSHKIVAPKICFYLIHILLVEIS